MEKTFDFNSVGKRMPYTVPDDFFAKMEESVMAQVAEEPNTKKPQRKAIRIAIRSLLAVAAAVALLFVVRTTLPKTDTDDFASVELAFNNLSTDDQDFLLAVYEEDEFIYDLTIYDLPFNEEDYE